MIRISFEKKALEAKNQEIFNGQLKEIEKISKSKDFGRNSFLLLLLILTFISLRTSAGPVMTAVCLMPTFLLRFPILL